MFDTPVMLLYVTTVHSASYSFSYFVSGEPINNSTVSFNYFFSDAEKKVERSIWNDSRSKCLWMNGRNKWFLIDFFFKNATFAWKNKNTSELQILKSVTHYIKCLGILNTSQQHFESLKNLIEKTKDCGVKN